MKNPKMFAHELCDWYRIHHRKLPFRETSHAYNILVSELMLQQTQMDTVIPYYERFIERFPDVYALADASIDEVLKMWEGLGYYRRAKHLHETAKMLVAEYNGKFPEDFESIRKLKGVGDYTAGAIASIAFNKRVPAVDGNVIRVLSRILMFNDDVTKQKSIRFFKDTTENLIQYETPRDFTQAMMELGALVCKKKPECEVCPVKKHCLAFKEHKQTDFPIKKAKKTAIDEHYITFILEYQNQYVLVRRPQDGLLANLLAFPQYETSNLDDALTMLSKDLNVTISSVSFLGQVKHIFSHRKWHMNVYLGKLNTLPKNLSLYDLDNLNEAMSKAHFKVSELIKRKA